MNKTLTLRRFALSLAIFAVAVFSSAMTAKADSVTVHGNSDPNLQATITITSFTNGSITFSVSNVLVAGVTSSITGVGFELPGVITANTPGACAGNCGNFTASPVVTNSPGNVPQFPAAVLDDGLYVLDDGREADMPGQGIGRQLIAFPFPIPGGVQ